MTLDWFFWLVVAPSIVILYVVAFGGIVLGVHWLEHQGVPADLAAVVATGVLVGGWKHLQYEPDQILT